MGPQFDTETIRQRMAARGYNAALSLGGPIPLEAWGQSYSASSRWTELDEARITDAESIPDGSAMCAMVWMFLVASEAELAATRERARWWSHSVGPRARLWAESIARVQAQETGEPWHVVHGLTRDGWHQIVPERYLMEEQAAFVVYTGQPAKDA